VETEGTRFILLMPAATLAAVMFSAGTDAEGPLYGLRSSPPRWKPMALETPGVEAPKLGRKRFPVLPTFSKSAACIDVEGPTQRLVQLICCPVAALCHDVKPPTATGTALTFGSAGGNAAMTRGADVVSDTRGRGTDSGQGAGPLLPRNSTGTDMRAACGL